MFLCFWFRLRLCSDNDKVEIMFGLLFVSDKNKSQSCPTINLSSHSLWLDILTASIAAMDMVAIVHNCHCHSATAIRWLVECWNGFTFIAHSLSCSFSLKVINNWRQCGPTFLVSATNQYRTVGPWNSQAASGWTVDAWFLYYGFVHKSSLLVCPLYDYGLCDLSALVTLIVIL